MNSVKRKEHWENVFKTKDTTKVSWHQPLPVISIRLFEMLNLPKTAKIMDAGCGDSYLPDYLLDKGYKNITLVDISEKALTTVKQRLGENSANIHFKNCDIIHYHPAFKFDLWHDRAAFHFLTDNDEINKYTEIVSSNILPGGYLIIGTFAKNGPNQCSGLDVHQYSENTLAKTFQNFKLLQSITENHNTPSGGNQNFIFCLFQKY